VLFTVVIPAFNAAGTLEKTLSSLTSQSCQAWEAIVVDDGSTDGTARVLDAAMRADNRFRIITQSNRGHSAARNAGIGATRGDWVVFLDADDWLLPRFLERIDTLKAGARDLDAARTGWARATTDGFLVQSFFPAGGQLFEVAARFCPFAIHSCAVRRKLVEEAGGFDEALTVCADWDFWQRIARTGPRIGNVDETLAVYRMRPGSVVSDVAGLLRNGLRQIALGHRDDPRVLRPAAAYRMGMADSGLAPAQFSYACWPAGMLLGSGRDARWVLESLPQDGAPELSASEVADSVFSAALLPRCLQPRDGLKLWAEIEDRLDAFLGDLERRSGTYRLAARARQELERLILSRVPGAHAVTVGRTHARTIDICELLQDVVVSSVVDRLRCAVAYDGVEIGEIELPVCDGFVPSAVLADAIVAELWWPVLWRFFARTIYSLLDIKARGSP
jgi:hypothetical protein